MSLVWEEVVMFKYGMQWDGMRGGERIERNILIIIV